MRDGGERQKPDRSELGVAGHAVVNVGEKEDRKNRDAPYRQQQPPDALAAADERLSALKNERHDDVIRYHDRERDGLDDHHGGGCRQSSHESGECQQVGAGGERQCQHEHVAVDAARLEREETGQRDRHDEKIDQQQIERKQPGRAPDLGLTVVLNDGNVKLARQQDDRKQRQERHRSERSDRRLAPENGCRLGLLQRAGEQNERSVEHPERHEHADCQEGDELDDRLGGDRQHQPVLVLGGVDMPGAEQHRERRHRERHQERNVADERLGRVGSGPAMHHEDGAQRR